jgi:hypothetical protein
MGCFQTVIATDAKGIRRVQGQRDILKLKVLFKL